MVSRLTKEMLKVIKADALNPRGLRNVIDGEAELLQHFEFNINGKLSTTLFAPYIDSIDRATGSISVEIAPFIPINMVAAPTGVTHFKFNAAGAEMDFEGANSSHPLFLVVGVEFFQQIFPSQVAKINSS